MLRAYILAVYCCCCNYATSLSTLAYKTSNHSLSGMEGLGDLQMGPEGLLGLEGLGDLEGLVEPGTQNAHIHEAIGGQQDASQISAVRGLLDTGLDGLCSLGEDESAYCDEEALAGSASCDEELCDSDDDEEGSGFPNGIAIDDDLLNDVLSKQMEKHASQLALLEISSCAEAAEFICGFVM